MAACFFFVPYPVSMPAFLKDLPIAITGASSGIGLATALRCSEAGMPVVLAARRKDRLESAVAQIKSSGGKALAVVCDVSQKGAGEELVDRTVKEFGSIYSVFANAGYGVERRVDESTDEEIQALFATNFWGTLWTIRPALEKFKAQRNGHILICSSVVSKITLPGFATYSSSKAMQDHFGRALRLELQSDPATQNIHVSTVHPVGTNTEFSQVVSANSGRPRRLGSSGVLSQSPDQVARAVVKSLYSPRGEIWTSFPYRVALGLGTVFPSIADGLLQKIANRKPQV